MRRRNLALVVELHHRMPWPGSLAGEDWARASADTYWPLMRTLSDAAGAGHDGVLTVAVSPSWTALARDPVAQALTRSVLDFRAEDRTGLFHERSHALRQFAVDRWGLDLSAALRGIADSGTIELIPFSSSHAWLPSVADLDVIGRAQIVLAARDHAGVYGNRPQGLWLPHHAYAPGLERTLADCDLRYFGVNAEAFVRGTIRPPRALFEPIVTRAGVAAFGIDPGPAELLVDSGRKYSRDPRYADPGEGLKAAIEHADHFVDRWRTWVGERMTADDPAVSVVAVSAHDLGGSWSAGSFWLGRVLARLGEASDISATTPARFLDRYPEGPVGRPGASVGGWTTVHPGGAESWLDRLQASAAVLKQALAHRAGLDRLGQRAAAQMTRELLLAQALDWAVPPEQAISPEEGLRRADARLDRFRELAGLLASGRVDPGGLAVLEDGPVFLPDIDLNDIDRDSSGGRR